MRLIAADTADPLVILMSHLDQSVRAASIRFACELGIRVAGTLPKPVGPAALRAVLAKPLPHRRSSRGAPIVRPTTEELACALDQGNIFAAFQPKVTLSDRILTGFEALARWHSPPHGPVPPEVFVPIAEESGLIVPLTQRVLDEALAACRRWRSGHPGCGVAVNISPLVLHDAALPDEIEALVQKYELPPGALIAEITESTMIANALVAMEVLTRLRIKGIGLSMDDFGTGYSPPLMLLRLPFTELKIDRSFIATCETDEEAWKIIRATISLARELGLSVVAEGVETERVEKRLRGAGCEMDQGWRFGHPTPEAALRQWLAKRAGARSQFAAPVIGCPSGAGVPLDGAAR